MRWSGAVLAGGRSSRFGRDKALYVYKGKPLIAWVLDSMAGASERLVIANRPYRLEVYPDLWRGGDTCRGCIRRSRTHGKTGSRWRPATSLS